jgi:hypothetical protein
MGGEFASAAGGVREPTARGTWSPDPGTRGLPEMIGRPPHPAYPGPVTARVRRAYRQWVTPQRGVPVPITHPARLSRPGSRPGLPCNRQGAPTRDAPPPVHATPPTRERPPPPAGPRAGCSAGVPPRTAPWPSPPPSTSCRRWNGPPFGGCGGFNCRHRPCRGRRHRCRGRRGRGCWRR